ncbi:S-acyltransferase 16-like [Raphidocelis subcapitata]|uniref:S-acyltransferase n=1 Tax=Raphidocelis subcapitata TaxID=307507 RepID=A0A2V0NJL9_9CHLO|nr:S-acyltransferase 16-like [Raphidocelis subcapitata]|eukprot:GBF87428.1 S-acyltransferase 16-like [Raphidocelis subcapitata]
MPAGGSATSSGAVPAAAAAAAAGRAVALNGEPARRGASTSAAGGAGAGSAPRLRRRTWGGPAGNVAAAALRALRRRWDWTVFGVLCVFFYLYVVSVTCVIIPWLSVSVPGMSNLAVLSGTAALALWCFCCCVLFDPGRVPPGWQPDAEGNARLQEVKRKDGGPRFCKKCQAYKPPRTHHCRVCNRCITRMDHHCPWTSNCVGHANYRPFFLLLIYGTAALWHAAGLLVAHAWHAAHALSTDRVLRAGPAARVAAHGSAVLVWHVLIEGLALCLALPAAVGMSSLLSFHVRMVLTNRTTIEWREGVTAQVNAPSFGAPPPRSQHPYDIGIYANLQQILGDGPEDWFWPPLRPAPGGTSFPTVFDADAAAANFGLGPSFKL